MTNVVNTQKIYTFDMREKILGRAASEIATILIKRNGRVEIKNVSELKITGKSKKNKLYRRHSGYPGGLTETPFKEIFAKNPRWILMHSIRGMLPKNRLLKNRIQRIRFI